MNDFDYDGYEDEPQRGAREASDGPELPGGVSLQTAAAILLVAVLLATLYLFFGPLPGSAPDDGASALTATPRSVSPTSTAGAAAASTPEASAPATAAPTTDSGAASTTPSAAQAPGAVATSAVVSTVSASAALQTGSFARVTGTGAYGLRMRFGPGLDFVTIRFADEGETLEVTGGPEQSDGLTWWRLRDDQGNIGWGAAEYLVPTITPGQWAPPAASPTFPPGSDAAAGQDETSGLLDSAIIQPAASPIAVATAAP